MSPKNLKFNWIKKNLSLKNLLICLSYMFLTFPFLMLFIFGLKKTWYDGLSVASIFYIGISLLSIIFHFAQFKTFSKIKNLFVVKKENNEKLTKMEKQQMRILNVKYDKLEEEKKVNDSSISFISIILLIYGLILLIISLPFLFI